MGQYNPPSAVVIADLDKTSSQRCLCWLVIRHQPAAPHDSRAMIAPAGPCAMPVCQPLAGNAHSASTVFRSCSAMRLGWASRSALGSTASISRNASSVPLSPMWTSHARLLRDIDSTCRHARRATAFPVRPRLPAYAAITALVGPRETPTGVRLRRSPRQVVGGPPADRLESILRDGYAARCELDRDPCRT